MKTLRIKTQRSRYQGDGLKAKGNKKTENSIVKEQRMSSDRKEELRTKCRGTFGNAWY